MAEQEPAGLLEMLLGSSVTDPSLDALSSDPTLANFLAELPKSHLDSLISTPQSLTTQSHTLTSSLTSLTYTSYPTFISLHAATNSLRSLLSSLSTSLDTLINDSLPALEGAAKDFRERSGPEVLGERTKARVVLEQHDKLRDLLDIPVLIDTCVRNGMYSEALSLASHASSSLAAMSSSSSLPLALSLNRSISLSLQSMLSVLLSTLREPGPARKLPALWKAVNFIRKMEVLGEDELALAFLSGRGECLNVALVGLSREHGVAGIADEAKGVSLGRDAEDVARFLRKYIDTWREGVYDIITQYTTIFLERTQNGPLTPTSSKHNKSSVPTSSPVLLHRLLTTYASHALTSLLLPTLERHLPHAPGALPSLLTQLTYCATAFARVGLDFSGVLEELFSNAVKEIVEREIREAGKKWQEKFKMASRKQSSVAWLIIPELAGSPPVGTLSLDAAPHAPPQILASYPPLAEYTNALLTTLNGLRLLAPVKITKYLLSALDQTLAESASVFLAYAKDDRIKDTDREVLEAAGAVFYRVFVPFIRRALIRGVYGLKITSGSGFRVDAESNLGKVLREWESWLDSDEESGSDSSSDVG